MPEEKFLRIEQRPVKVFPGLAFVRGFGDMAEGGSDFRFGGGASDRRKIEFAQDFLVGKLLGQEFASLLLLK